MSTRYPWTVERLDLNSNELLPDDWQRLNQRCCGAHPLLSADFFTALLRHFPGEDVYLAALHDRELPIAMALLTPLTAMRWALYHPSQAPLGPILLDSSQVDPDRALADLLDTLPGQTLQLDLTQLDPTFFPVAFDSNRVERIHYVTTMAVSPEGSFETYLSNRPRKLRSNLRRYRRRLEEAGMQIELKCLTDPQAVAETVDEHGRLESSGWKGEIGTAMRPDNSQGRFYRDLMKDHAYEGKGWVYCLNVDGSIAATWLVIRGGGMISMLKTAYDESLAKYSVGRVLLVETLEELFKIDGVQSIEFYTNANADQLEWATDSRSIEHLNFYRHQAVQRSRAAARRANQVFRQIQAVWKRKP
ncbi:GNAT family N-acetyltransferase [Halorhodospira halophila]|uniref:BioF2-like acetyltransferase domain-containing protein n=1 Tax=Halorhodospira halophila (strain DSM 244 / SL1) TaxID=349124 RepID=A1WXC0_HALHL|nr:GNAT family N-acetyltransferase [Halorhodospira halophila]ABM62332.1 conserved hypothetical protein [Halorhodospira halophila SL1]MBK1730067.1 GNAT family N-acetyltransferase [Halorhodospira halophila]